MSVQGVLTSLANRRTQVAGPGRSRKLLWGAREFPDTPRIECVSASVRSTLLFRLRFESSTRVGYSGITIPLEAWRFRDFRIERV